MIKAFCEWTEESDGYEGMNMWETECGEAFYFEGETMYKGEAKYCLFCGRIMRVLPFVYQEEQDD